MLLSGNENSERESNPIPNQILYLGIEILFFTKQCPIKFMSGNK